MSSSVEAATAAGGAAPRVAVLASGRGSNFESLAQAFRDREIPGEIVLLVVDKPGAGACAIAERFGIPWLLVRGRRRDRDAFDAALLDVLRQHAVDYVFLAGFMRILGRAAVAAYWGRILNIHPSLLPAFPGLAAQAQALGAGVEESGCTVHFVDFGVDTGPIVVQRGGVSIQDTDTAASLYFDHLYPLGIEAIAEAVANVAAGTARYLPQDESLATHQGLVDDVAARIDWSQTADRIDRLIRGCDPQPGALTQRGDEAVRLFDGGRVAGSGAEPPGTLIAVEDGRLIIAAQGGRIAVGRVSLAGGPKLAAVDSGLAPGDRLG